ncbi:MAG: hypothetical protein HKN57_01405 [Xanthomonadales bacterium]|nr:hypothetical protein [Gammaproteobacteria bacterium]MBT8054856.1 hypothetical protein [Gammaproteobacteria bacterium]NND55886.1 hypothetical protein [Xanthomonadales bacterium]NNK51385.1 hypothetical protein [Xanthomonadales bacterium]NNL93983.1 hypothetical protein [Xanthomonadales bacterium]
MPADKDNKDQLDPESGNVDQIREILFGGHIRAFDERFELVEARLAKETDALRKATEKKTKDIERVLTEYREEASDRLGAETNNLDLALNKLEIALGQSRADADAQMASMEGQFASELKQLRSDMQAMHKELAAALAKAERQQQKDAEKLGSDKVARRDLAALFSTLAQKLQPESKSRKK